ncbi:DUF1853 family protein [sulfur-oxidizing endosymbiont of Gigantopelta aegis]|uniref:DUF1853 family protein n=1 Tax=sulfur-oxidizing endosymbiont of Gigantopelta aegis TaxID=2794934 RepID=UPI001BE4D634|nr:DUF1853 family protein [sulfur-oxidizing endosymbiont of Gigantopelta aegis]
MKDILLYSQYSDPQVRALVWSLLSPGLVNESGVYPTCATQQWCQSVYEQIQPALAQLNDDPSELKHWLENYKSWRLGIRFEAYWAFIFELLKKQHDCQSYATHLQVQTQLGQGPFSKTLGEMDLVYQEKDSQLHHLELAVKFYLLKANAFGFERLIGPNGGDWYQRKLEHLFKKQLPLSETQDGKNKLVEHFELDIEQVSCQHQGLIKGMIFLPVTEEGSLNDNEKDLLNPEFYAGSWGTIQNWYLADPGEIGRWVILEKLSWLEPQVYAPSYPELEDKLFTAKEMAYKLKAHFHNTRRSILIARLDFDEVSQLWLEQQRVMVVDKYWPVFERSIETMFEKAGQRTQDLNENKKL